MPFFKHGRFVNFDSLSNTKENQTPLPEPRSMSVDDIEIMEQIRYLYIDRGMTAKKVCEMVGGDIHSRSTDKIGEGAPQKYGARRKKKVVAQKKTRTLHCFGFFYLKYFDNSFLFTIFVL